MMSIARTWTALVLLAAGGALAPAGCGDGSSGRDDGDSSEAETADPAGDDTAEPAEPPDVPEDQELVPDIPADETPLPDGTDTTDVTHDDAADAAEDPSGEEPGETCGPHWHPTSCGDCGGSGIGDQCTQGCNPASCGDGREYLAECDGTTHTCTCTIDGVEVCTCTSANPVGDMGCEPEEWGGANCCWNVG